jgi:predicted anti-sigma-YlaC factor YlaD
VPLRLLARAAPFVLGAVAAGIWLHRRQPPRPALREVTGELPPPVPPVRARHSVRRFVRRPVDIVTIVDDLLGAPG